MDIDIDVVFVRHDLARDDALQAIGAGLAAAQKRIAALGYKVELRKNKDGTEAKLFVRSADVEVKVEVNFVFRGTVMTPTSRSFDAGSPADFRSRQPLARALNVGADRQLSQWLSSTSMRTSYTSS